MTKETTTKPKRRYARGPGKGNAAEGQTSFGEAAAPKRETKIGIVIALLERKEGATLGEMIEATGWLKHTTRAALTGLRKKGHEITRDKRVDVTCYRIAKGV
ncbi:DUF3489 domain-containing protein [Erythrobacter alti]|uniref:DUF3489 domain-containing protein n=1 Tax=Erythrobacter alti TaxID=1896145 RepID=UPI0030F4370C